MKITSLASLALAAVTITSCSGLGELSSDNFTVVPSPLEAVAGQVPVTINGRFPEKYMNKKATVTVTPVLRYAGKEIAGQPATFQGEKVVEIRISPQAMRKLLTFTIACVPIPLP